MADEMTVPGDPDLVVRDHGGDGEQSIVLLHGFGGNALHWTEFAPLLTPRYRVVAVDQRCHGRSGDGPWHWDALVSDVERVAEHLDLQRPVVVGHSLGGGVAAYWASRHPECPGAVDLDGIRAVETALDNYVGLDEQTAYAQRAELTAVFDEQANSLAGPLSDEHCDALREQQRQEGGESAVAMLERNFVVADGATYLRPDAATVGAFRTGWQQADLVDVFGQATCPLLVCAATRNLPGTERFADLLQAHRRGIDRDLTAVARANPSLLVEYPDASHGMVHEMPEELAELVGDFLDSTS